MTNLVHSGSLSSFEYTLNPDGMRHTISETLKTSSSTSETHNITYTYDNLNRLTNESATCSSPSGSYSEEYTFDVVGNRTKRVISANGQCMRTDYVYNNRDQLTSEVHDGPVWAMLVNDRPVYAYANGNGGFTYRGADGNIGTFKAFILGLPIKYDRIVNLAAMLSVLIIFLAPVLLPMIRKITKLPAKKSVIRLSLFHRCVSVFLAYLMLLTPYGFENIKPFVKFINIC